MRRGELSVFKRLTAELGQQLARLGVNLNFVYAEPFEEFYAACDNKPPSFVNKWLWQDPIEAIQGFSRSDCACEGSPNWQSSRIPSVDAAFDDFLRARTEEDTRAAAGRLQEVFMLELPYVPLCAPEELMATRADLRGFGLVEATLYPYYDQVALS